MRGEKNNFLFVLLLLVGSPPHARGKDIFTFLNSSCVGITPACAGKSEHVKKPGEDIEDHPRMRGEKAAAADHAAGQRGSPPHARGKE